MVRGLRGTRERSPVPFVSGVPAVDGVADASAAGLATAFDTPVCGACRHVNFALETHRPSLRYEGVGRGIVHALKYRGYTAVVDRLPAPLLAEVVEDPDALGAVVPVPLHRARLRRCGFNQTALPARGLVGRINTPVSDTLQVVRSTRYQVELSAAERRRSLVGAFSAGGRARGGPLPVDGVLATNATANPCATACANACAAALLDAGAAKVHAVTPCRPC